MLNVVILILIIEAAYSGWKNGLIQASSVVIATMIATLMVKIKGDRFLWRIFEIIEKLLNRGLGSTPDQTYYQQVLGDENGAELMKVLGFVVAFAVLVIGFRFVMEILNTRKVPVVGQIDGLLGAVLGVIGRMCTFWVVCMALRQMAGENTNLLEALNNSNGLFRVIYDTNPFIHIL